MNLLRHVSPLLALAGIALQVSATVLPPDVLSSGSLRAPYYQIPHSAGGASIYEGQFTLAGAYLIETDPYDLFVGQPIARFNVRNASDRSLRYQLDPLASGQGLPDAVVFADTREFALRTHDVADGPARIAIHDLADGTRRLVLTQPSGKAGDDFGRNVWFTTTRILVAAPGRDFRKRDAGAIYLFDRATGRHLGMVGPGLKDAYFGSEPIGSYGIDGQLPGVPYVQSSGPHTIIVHGLRVYRLADKRLVRLSLPSKSILTSAFIAENRIILVVKETTNGGRTSHGRVIAYDLATGRLRYQLTSLRHCNSALSGPYFTTSGDRLFAYLSSSGDESRSMLHSFRVSDGARINSIEWSDVAGVSVDGNTLTLSADKLWLRSFTTVPGEASITTWIARDPETLAETLRLTPPGDDRFIGAAPQPIGDGRLGVFSSRTTSDIIILPIGADKRAVSNSSSSAVDNLVDNLHNGYTTYGVLVFDSAKSEWTHRLLLESDFNSTYWSQNQNDLRPLRAAPGYGPHLIDVSSASGAIMEIASYDLALPYTAPVTTLEGSLSYTLARGYDYTLHRSADPATEFSFHRGLGLGDGTFHEVVVPYFETLGDVAYLLDGEEFSRRLSTPEPDPLAIGSPNDSNLAAFYGKKIAVSVLSAVYQRSYYSTPTVKLLDLATGETLLTVFPGRNGPVALGDRYLAVGDTGYEYAGKIDIFDVATGTLLRSLTGTKRFGNDLALSGDHLVTTSVVSAYQSGIYTHTAQVSAYSLPGGQLLYSRPFASLTNTYHWSHPPTDLVVAADSIIVRSHAPDGISADSGRVRVLDLATGDLRYELSSPAPEPGDYFGAWLAADGDYLAVGSSGTSEVFVFDLPTGNLLHTLILSDRPEGIVNYSTSLPRLTIDADTDRLSWFVNDNVESGPSIFFITTAVYLFDLRTGLEEAKVLPPSSSSSIGGHLTGFGGAILDGDRLLAPTLSGSLLVYPLADALSAPLAATSEVLAPTPTVCLEFLTRRGIIYQPEFSADADSTWSALGAPHEGDGRPATLRRSLTGQPAPETLRFRLRTAWK